jgi:hypothetical protein
LTYNHAKLRTENNKNSSTERTAAKNVARNLFRSNQVFGVRLREVALEVGVANHFGEVRPGLGVTQEALGEEDDQLQRESVKKS